MIAIPGITIQNKIYESSNSLVYRGIRDDGLAIIIKLLKQDYPTPQEIIRYRQEYELTRSLNLAGVIKAYSQQDYQRTRAILLEDFGGESLEYWRQQCPESFYPTPLSLFLPLAIDITDILSRIHAARVIHKDINSSNIVFNPNTGVVKLIDFGIATRFSRTSPTFKSHNDLEGTLAYLSPEQTGRMNRLLDYRTDFYSLGVTFYELLTGQLPFATTDMLELVHCHIAKQPISPHELNATIPPPISEIILKLMAKNAEDRYQNAWGIKADLEYCVQQLEATGQIDPIQLGLQDVSDQFQIPQKLYGREAEVAVLLAAFDRVVGIKGSSHQVEMMLVSGYAGVGKSALVQEIYKPITQKRGYFVSGKFDQFQRNIPYSAIVDALQKLVRQLLSEPDEQVQQWRSRLLAALGNTGQLIIDVIPEVELIVGKQSPVPEVGAPEAQNRFNRVFGQFIRVFCSAEHPLAIFLDDLQWIDSATLKLVELMLLDQQTQFLFLIGAYRDQEVNSTHPLVLTLERLRNQGTVLQEIKLSPLTLEPLTQLTAETLHQNVDTVRSLAELVLHKTGGNPFFVNEFLWMLYSENLLSFDSPQSLHTKEGSKGGWQWDINEIQAQNITDNVVELLLFKLRKLLENTQHVLRLAACIGAEFDLETLAIISERSSKAVSLDLLAAVQAGLIQPLSELDENLFVQAYKFLHDRVQQAAYALIDDSQKQIVHLQIGRNLLKNPSEPLLDQLFEIVDHLNHGIELVPNQLERDEIARLNLLAGQKAKRAIAYDTARIYLAASRAWLAASSWQTTYELTLEVYLETAEVAYLCGEFEQVESWAAIVLQSAKTLLDSVKVYEVKIQAYMAQSQPLKAIDTGLQVLRQLGISFPETPAHSDILLELDAITSLLNARLIEDLVDLPEMSDSDKLAAMRILSSITIAAYLAAADLMSLLVSKQVNLSIEYGNASVSPFAYTTFGMILCETVENIESGYQFGQIALGLLSKYSAHASKARTLTGVYHFIIHWKEHLRESLEPVREAYQSGLETGDLEFASYAAYVYCFHSFIVGKELVGLEREIRTYNEAIRQFKQEVPLIWVQLCQQSVLNLMGCSVNPIRLIGEAYSEEKGLPQHGADDGSTILSVYFHKLCLCYLFCEYAQALENSALAKSYLLYAGATPLKPLYYFYDSLAKLATYLESNRQVQEEILKVVAVNQEKMQYWAQHAPMNYLHKYYLVEAEKSRVVGQLFEAEEFYEQSIQGARENEYLQEEALAYELAAKHYLARGREKFAQLYMKEAHYCYERWGAVAKVKDLESRYPQFFPQLSSSVSTPIHKMSGGLSDRSNAFDLASVMKASQAISSEIELGQLLNSLMKILIENAGAQTGFLILENSGEWVIEAACEPDLGETDCATRVLQSISIADRLPPSIIQYVIRTHESLILNDATCESNFIHRPYIQRYQPQSILCLPLLNQSKLVGVLYLENRLVTGAFTADRTQVLHLLSTQAAIAIENAKLYSELRASESRLTQFLEAVPVGIGIVDAAGRPHYANQRAIQLLGKGVDPTVPPEQIAEAYQFYLAGTDQTYPTERLPIIRALNSEQTRKDDIEIHHSNATIPLEVWGTPVYDEQNNVAYAIAAFQDISQRKQAERLLADYNCILEQQVAERTAALQASEAALQASGKELRALFAAIPDPTFVLSAEGRVIKAAEVDASRLYKPLEEQLGKTLHELFEPEQADEFIAYIHQVLRTQQTLTVEYSLWMHGRKQWFSANVAPIWHDQVIWIARDITEQRDAALRERKRAEEAAILEERNRMAREIHDTLAQSFTGILVQVTGANQVLIDDLEAVQAHLTMINELARTGLAEARRSVKALRPQLLEEGDLSSALNRLTTQMQLTTDTPLIYEIQGTAYSLPAEVENNLLRIGQEALTNAIKYAGASEIRIKLVYDSVQCILRIKDDGQGFRAGSVLFSDGFGLLGMSERAERIGAQLRIGSQPGQGTEIVVIVSRAGAV